MDTLIIDFHCYQSE